ncbi:uncharacterized protein LOC123528183 isoform X2 [Mercenaria mercenaria]|uniref:uncharacterized protein LOC123528183 isoform X2 n=1 Tax=Mercenaria mercenaria TaxID=6596 RepID=UPI00234F9C3A|nr:uncharacterized protein LOC123528183 isoform X2 [Mercenaria mercenaria]
MRGNSVSGQLHLLETMSTESFCSFSPFSLNCGDDVIAVERVLFAYRAGCDSTCCTFDSEDCLVNSTELETAYIRRICSGHKSCDLDLAGSRDFCNLGTKEPSYVQVKYYCIPETRVVSICSSRTTSSDGPPLYLTNENYPSVTTGDATCSCSIEVYNCSSSIHVYTIDADLYYDTSYCNQSLDFVEGSNTSLKDIRCESYYGSPIIVNILNTHYVKVTFLDNEAEDQEGYFFLGFSASIPDTRFSISCSSEQESWCVGCGALPSIPNGYLELKEQGNTSYKSKAATVCDDGYETVTAEVTCLANASWEGVVCTVKDCGSSISVAFGSASLDDINNSTYGAAADVTCIQGYEGSKAMITCLSTGSWDTVNCTPKDCGPVPSIQHGYVDLRDDGNTSYGATAEVICDSGYKSTTREIVCPFTGIWENVTDCLLEDAEKNSQGQTGASKETKDGLSAGYIALIVVLSILVVGAAGFGSLVIYKRKRAVTPSSYEKENPLERSHESDKTVPEPTTEATLKRNPVPEVPKRHEIKHGHVYIDHGEAHIFGITIHLPHPFTHT